MQVLDFAFSLFWLHRFFDHCYTFEMAVNAMFIYLQPDVLTLPHPDLDSISAVSHVLVLVTSSKPLKLQ